MQRDFLKRESLFYCSYIDSTTMGIRDQKSYSYDF